MEFSKYTEKLKTMKLFEGICTGDYLALLRCLGGHVKTYDKDVFMVLDGDQISLVGAVLSGKVQMIKEAPFTGSKSIFAIIGEGDIFGESLVCSDNDSTFVSFQTAAPSAVLFLLFRNILCTCKRACPFHRRLIENMATIMARKNTELMKKIEILSKNSIRERVLAYLSQRTEKDGTAYITTLGRTDLADFLSVDRSALSRELSRMKREGILDFNKNIFRMKHVDYRKHRDE